MLQKQRRLFVPGSGVGVSVSVATAVVGVSERCKEAMLLGREPKEE